MSEHKTRRYGDQYHCHLCGKQWDVNDPEPPRCIEKGPRKAKVRRRIEELKEQLALARDS